MADKTLILMRHGKSNWSGDGADDFARPLSKRGIKDTPQMAAWLGEQQLIPDTIVSSPAERASATARLVANKLSISADGIVYDTEIYEADRQQLLEVISRHGQQSERLMLVGHNPAMDELLSFLVTGSLPLTKKGKLMTTAAIAVLSCDNWQLQRGDCRLQKLMRPKELD